MSKHCFGEMLVLDLYKCDPIAIDDLNVCYSFLDQAVAEIGVHKQAPPEIFRSPIEFADKVGLSGGVYLIESNITIHTLTLKRYVSIIFYTCSDMTDEMKEKLVEFSRLIFNPEKIDQHYLPVGSAYYD